jgi:hypothetical protein
MIRASLDPGSQHASMYVTPDGRRAFQTRPDDGGGVCLTAHSLPGAIGLPYWIKLQRIGDQFTAYHSPDGVNWIKQADDEDVMPYQTTNPATIDMPATVYIGFVLSSHNPGLATNVTFSDVTTTGYVGTQWQVADIGCDHPGNSPGLLYLLVVDGNGGAAGVIHPDPGIVNVTTWTEWRIPFRAMARVDLKRVKKICIGVRARETPIPLGSGRLLIDNLLAWKP